MGGGGGGGGDDGGSGVCDYCDRVVIGCGDNRDTWCGCG